MKRYLMAITAAIMMVAPLAISTRGYSRAQEKPKGDVEAGRGLYAENCKKCHGVQGEGVPRVYKLVKATVVHLGSPAAQNKSDAEISKAITSGFNKMEAVKGLTPDQVANILAFTRALKQ